MRGTGSIRQSKLVARRRRRLFYLCLYTLSAAGLFLSLLSYISSLEALSVNNIVISGNSRLASSTVDAIVRADLAGTDAYFFSRANFLLYDKNQIAKDLLDLPLIKSVTVRRNTIHTLSISITERQPRALWCAGRLKETAYCYASDDEGFVFTTQNIQPGMFIYRGNIEGNPIGSHIQSEADFKKSSFFMTELAKLSVQPTEVSLSASSTYMTIVLAGGGSLIVNTKDDLSAVLGNISTIISDTSLIPNLSKFLAKLDYMKLDVGNKVIFKLRE